MATTNVACMKIIVLLIGTLLVSLPGVLPSQIPELRITSARAPLSPGDSIKIAWPSVSGGQRVDLEWRSSSDTQWRQILKSTPNRQAHWRVPTGVEQIQFRAIIDPGSAEPIVIPYSNSLSQKVWTTGGGKLVLQSTTMGYQRLQVFDPVQGAFIRNHLLPIGECISGYDVVLYSTVNSKFAYRDRNGWYWCDIITGEVHHHLPSITSPQINENEFSSTLCTHAGMVPRPGAKGEFELSITTLDPTSGSVISNWRIACSGNLRVYSITDEYVEFGDHAKTRRIDVRTGKDFTGNVPTPWYVSLASGRYNFTLSADNRSVIVTERTTGKTVMTVPVSFSSSSSSLFSIGFELAAYIEYSGRLHVIRPNDNRADDLDLDDGSHGHFISSYHDSSFVFKRRDSIMRYRVSKNGFEQCERALLPNRDNGQPWQLKKNGTSGFYLESGDRIIVLDSRLIYLSEFSIRFNFSANHSPLVSPDGKWLVIKEHWYYDSASGSLIDSDRFRFHDLGSRGVNTGNMILLGEQQWSGWLSNPERLVALYGTELIVIDPEKVQSRLGLTVGTKIDTIIQVPGVGVLVQTSAAMYVLTNDERTLMIPYKSGTKHRLALASFRNVDSSILVAHKCEEGPYYAFDRWIQLTSINLHTGQITSSVRVNQMRMNTRVGSLNVTPHEFDSAKNAITVSTSTSTGMWINQFSTINGDTIASHRVDLPHARGTHTHVIESRSNIGLLDVYYRSDSSDIHYLVEQGSGLATGPFYHDVLGVGYDDLVIVTRSTNISDDVLPRTLMNETAVYDARYRERPTLPTEITTVGDNIILGDRGRSVLLIDSALIWLPFFLGQIPEQMTIQSSWFPVTYNSTSVEGDQRGTGAFHCSLCSFPQTVRFAYNGTSIQEHETATVRYPYYIVTSCPHRITRTISSPK